MNRNIFKNIIIAFLIYSLGLLLIGRNLTFIPEIKFSSTKPKTYASDIRKSVLEKFLKGEQGSYSIYYKDLKTGQSFGIDENKVLTGASLNKLPIVAYLYNLASRGKIDLEDSVVIQKADIQDYGTGSLRYQKPGSSYSLKTLTKLALEQSDNTAAHVLGVRLDLANVQKYINGLGFVSTDMANDKTTAFEMAKLLELIWQRKVTNESLTREMLDFMRDTDFEDRLVRDIPKNIAVYHKAGDAVGMIHDVGIIDNGKNPFILSVLTSDMKSTEHTKQTIGKIAKFVLSRQD